MEIDQKEQKLRVRVRADLLELMRRMDFGYSTRLLSENQLAAKLQVSRSTIRAVLTELETEGKVFRRQGSGTYVNPPALDVETTIYPRVNTHELLEKNGYEALVKILSVEEQAAEERGLKLNLYPFDKIIELRSVYCGDDVPCMYCIDWMDAKRYAGVDWRNYEQVQGSIYDFIRAASGIDIVWDIINIRASDSNQLPELREVFCVPEGSVKSVVHLEIINFDVDNRPSLLGNIFVDTDRIKLNIVRDLTKK